MKRTNKSKIKTKNKNFKTNSTKKTKIQKKNFLNHKIKNSFKKNPFLAGKMGNTHKSSAYTSLMVPAGNSNICYNWLIGSGATFKIYSHPCIVKCTNITYHLFVNTK